MRVRYFRNPHRLDYASLVFRLFRYLVRLEIEQEICVAGNIDYDGKFVFARCIFKRAAINFDNQTKSRDAVLSVAFGINDFAFVERNTCQMSV